MNKLNKQKIYRVRIERDGEAFIGYIRSKPLGEYETLTVTNLGPMFEEPEEENNG